MPPHHFSAPTFRLPVLAVALDDRQLQSDRMIVLAAAALLLFVVVRYGSIFRGFGPVVQFSRSRLITCVPDLRSKRTSGRRSPPGKARRANAIASPSARVEQAVRPDPGGGPAAREPGLGTGRGGDVTGSANSCPFSAKKLSAERSVRRAKPTSSDRIAIVVSRSDSRSLPTARPGIPDCRE